MTEAPFQSDIFLFFPFQSSSFLCYPLPPIHLTCVDSVKVSFESKVAVEKINFVENEIIMRMRIKSLFG